MPHAIIGFYENVEKFHEELAPDRYRNILGAKETYMLAVDLEEKINLLIDNHHEFEVELLKLAEANRTWPKTEAMDAMQKRLLLDRRIVNLLSACRLYLDQSSHAMSCLFGSESTELAAANERRSAALEGRHAVERFVLIAPICVIGIGRAAPLDFGTLDVAPELH